jgi:hypothetical protein
MDAMATNFLLKAEGSVDRLINVNFVCYRSIEKGISPIFAGSIAEDVTNHSRLPIITFKI